MLVGIFHPGSGLGNQLHRYVATRVLAEDKGFEFGMLNTEGFKGASFMGIDMGLPVEGDYIIDSSGKITPAHGYRLFEEKKIVENGVDIRSFDPEWKFVEDNTIIDGEFQDEKYFKHRIRDIDKWFHVEPLGMPNNLCVLGFRGGEFQHIPDLFLSREYWDQAIHLMRLENTDMRFIAVTDDPELASAYLPQDVKVTHDIATDWRMIRNANYLIISNSSFYILPSLLNNHVKKVIAPRCWARRNTGTWALPSNYYSDPRWMYI